MSIDFLSSHFLDLHRKNSPTGLKRLNSALQQDPRSGKSFPLIPFPVENANLNRQETASSYKQFLHHFYLFSTVCIRLKSK